MKKTIIALALLAANIAPAHAISATYRAQLEREHKTQVQDATGPQKPAAYKPGNWPVINIKKNGIEFRRSRDGFAYINGSPAAQDENNADATVYSAGLITVIVYKKTGRINAMEDGRLLGRLR